MTLHRITITLCIVSLLSGCAAAIIGGGAAATSVAIDRRTTGTVIDDEGIELKASSLINKDAELKENSHISITSYNTRVLLTGEVTNESLKNRFIEQVKKIERVSHINDELEIAAPTSLLSRSNDGVLTTKLKAMMLAEENLPGVHIKIVTENSVVYLMGLVTHAEGDKATAVARKAGGVKKVVKLFEYTD